MRARPNPSGDQLVTDYLIRVAELARGLPKGARMAFVGRTRALVESEVGPPGTRTDPGLVSAVLERLGTPEDLVLEERTRIDRGWVKSRAYTKEEGEAAAAALTGPRMNRPLTARRRPNTDAYPSRWAKPANSGTGSVIPAEGTPVTGFPGAGTRRPGLRIAGPPSTDPPGTGPGSAGPPGSSPRGSGPRGAGPPSVGAGHPDAPPLGALPPGAPPGGGPAGPRRSGPVGWLTGKGAGMRGLSGNETLANAGQLARGNVLETIAILLLGLGGLILPYVFWPVGAIVAMFSRLWDLRDKSLAVAGPLLVTLAGSVLVALIIGGSGNVILVYFHALGVGFGIMIRVGSVLTAAYLAWRVTRGPRVKLPPWERIRRP